MFACSETVAFLLKGALIGFSIAAPVGPIGLLCIRRSLAGGRTTGLATGLGAATADAIYGAIAAFGLTSISRLLVGQRFWLGLVGGLFLFYLGLRTFRAAPSRSSVENAASEVWKSYSSTLLLTLTNPTTILSFVAVFAGLGLGNSQDFPGAFTMVLGVFLGSALWWLFLSSGISLVRPRVNDAWMKNINRISGTIIIAMGVYSLWQLRAP